MKTQTIKFSEFMDGSYKNKRKKEYKVNSFVISPLAFIDPVFCCIAGGFVAVAFIQKGLGISGNVAIAEAIGDFLEIAVPIISSGVFIYFLLTNPIGRLL